MDCGFRIADREPGGPKSEIKTTSARKGVQNPRAAACSRDIRLRASKIRREPLVDPSRGFRRDAVPLLVVEESEPGRLAEEAVNGERRGDEGPAAISVGGVAAEEEKGPRSDERQKLVMLPNVSNADVEIVWDPPWSAQRISPEGKQRMGMG